jgi:hypothetical protein
MPTPACDDAGEFGLARIFHSLFPAAHHDLTVFGINAYSNSINATVTKLTRDLPQFQAIPLPVYRRSLSLQLDDFATSLAVRKPPPN